MSEKKTDIIGDVAKEIDSALATFDLSWREKLEDERNAVSTLIAVAAVQAYEKAKIKSLQEHERFLFGKAGMPVSALEQAYINSILRNGFN